MKFTYENRATDYTYRDDNNHRIKLSCSPHLHSHVEFFCLLEGKTRAWIDSEEYTVEPGDLLISFPNRVHCFEEIEPEKYMLFIAHPDMMPELAHIFGKQTPQSALVKRACEDEELLPLLHRLREAMRGGGPYQDVIVKGLLLAAFGHILPKLNLAEPQGEDSHAIRAIVTYCTQHFRADLSLEALERELHLSRYYISHLFSHKLNIRLTDYVNSLRVSEACRLLRAEDMSMTEVCEMAGFNTLRTFNRSFIKQMGLSPSDYRKEYR